MIIFLGAFFLSFTFCSCSEGSLSGDVLGRQHDLRGNASLSKSAWSDAGHSIIAHAVDELKNVGKTAHKVLKDASSEAGDVGENDDDREIAVSSTSGVQQDADVEDSPKGKKQKEIEEKLKDIETMQKAIEHTLDNTTQSLIEIQQLKSDLEKKVESVNEKQEEMEGTKEKLKAAVRKIADVGKDILDRNSEIEVDADVALSEASEVQKEESEIGQALGETAEDLEVAVEENAAEKLELEGEKIAVEAKAAEVDEEAQIQLNRSAVINNILNETKEILAENVADEIENTKAALKAEQETIIEKAETMTEESKREESIKSELEVLENKVTTDEAALEEKNRRIAHKNGVLSAKVKKKKKKEKELEEQVLKKQIELDAKEKALDKKVIDEIINKTAKIIDEKVKDLAEDLKRKIEESNKKPNDESAVENPTKTTGNGTSTNNTSSNSSPAAGAERKIVVNLVTDVATDNKSNGSQVDGDSDEIVEVANSTATNSTDNNGSLIQTNGVEINQNVSNGLPVEEGVSLSPTPESSTAGMQPEVTTMPSSVDYPTNSTNSLTSDQLPRPTVGAIAPDSTLLNSSQPDVAPESSLNLTTLTPVLESGNVLTFPNASSSTLSTSTVTSSVAETQLLSKVSTIPSEASNAVLIQNASVQPESALELHSSAFVPTSIAPGLTTSMDQESSKLPSSTSAYLEILSKSEISGTDVPVKLRSTSDDVIQPRNTSVTPLVGHMVFVGGSGGDGASEGGGGQEVDNSILSTSSVMQIKSSSVPHMIFVGKDKVDDGGQIKEAPKITVKETKESSGEEDTEVDLAAGVGKGGSENVTIVEPKHVITIKSKATELQDKHNKGHMIFNETISIVDKPLSAMGPDDISALTNNKNAEVSALAKDKNTEEKGEDLGMAALMQESHTTSSNLSAVAALSQEESAASGEKKSGYLGAAGWVFIGLLVCVLCVLVIVAAVFGARRRHANAQKLQNKDRPNSLSANAQFSSASQGSQSRPSYSAATGLSSKRIPLSQRIADNQSNRGGYYFSAGYVDDISRMPEGSDVEIGTRKALSLAE